MSTLSIASPRVAPESEVDARFDALVRAVPAQRDRRDETVFETVFDLDYGQPLTDSELTAPEPVVHQPRARIRRASRVRKVAPPSTTPPAVRLTRRGRLVLVIAFLSIVVALMIPMAGLATASLTGGTPEPVRVIEVAPGDTLYAIAAELAEPGEIREMVHRIQELNSLPSAQIDEGQKLAVPRG
jgi:hypothetical protein